MGQMYAWNMGAPPRAEGNLSCMVYRLNRWSESGQATIGQRVMCMEPLFAGTLSVILVSEPSLTMLPQLQLLPLARPVLAWRHDAHHVLHPSGQSHSQSYWVSLDEEMISS